MVLKADLHYRNRYTMAEDCVIEKTVRIPGEQFETFSQNLLKPQGFIRENQSHMFLDDSNMRHCLLVTGEGRADGIIIFSEGYDFANYACHIPDAKALTLAQSPALTALGEKLSACVERLAADYLTMLEKGERAAMYVFEEAQEYGVDATCSATLRDTVIEMLGEKLAAHNLDMELDNGELILTPAPEMAGPEQNMTM